MQQVQPEIDPLPLPHQSSVTTVLDVVAHESERPAAGANRPRSSGLASSARCARPTSASTA